MLTDVKRREKLALKILEAKDRGEELDMEDLKSCKSKAEQESIRNIDLNLQKSTDTVRDAISNLKPSKIVKKAPIASRKSSKFNVGYAAMFRSGIHNSVS